MFNKNKKVFSILLLLLVTSVLFTSCGKTEDGVIAKVNGKSIKLDDFNKEFEIAKTIRQKQYGDDVLEKDVDGKLYKDILREEIFNMLVDEEVIAQDLEKLEIGITDAQVKEQMDFMKESYIKELGGEEEYKKFLEDNGFTEDYLKATIRRELMVQEHRNDFLNKIHLKDSDIDKYYKENKDGMTKLRISHILVENEKNGQVVLNELKDKNTDFHALAAKESIDPQTAEKGGDLGFVRKGDLEKMGLGELEEPVFKLKEKEHTGLVKSGLGYHIVYLEERLDSKEKLKDDIMQSLKYEKYIDKVKELKESADLEILDKSFKF